MKKEGNILLTLLMASVLMFAVIGFNTLLKGYIGEMSAWILAILYIVIVLYTSSRNK